MDQDLTVLNKQAIAAAQNYTGHFALGTVLFTLAVVGLFVANLWLTAIGILPLWVGFLLYATLTYMAYTSLHEAAHGNIHGKHYDLKWVNDFCGYLGSQVVSNPYSTHTVEHFTHHRYTNQPDKDPDYVIKKMGNGPVSAFTASVEAMWAQLTFIFHGYWATATQREKIIYCAELGGAFAWRFALLAFMPVTVWFTLIVGGYIAAVIFTLYWFAYRPHHPYADSARYRNTNSLIAPKWMAPFRWFFLGQDLHSIHHAFPRVPFYKYHALFNEIEPILRAHGNPIIGMFDRKPREISR